MGKWRVLLMAAVCLPAGAQWKALGPFGGPAAVVQTDPSSPDRMLAGTSNALLYRSRDGGGSWESLPFPLQLRALLHTLVIHPANGNLCLAGISAETPGVSGLWRSEDGGWTWQPVRGFENLPVRAIAVFRGNPQVMAAGTDTGVFQSMDAGLAWTRISPSENRQLQPVVSVAFDPKDGNVVYAGTPHLPWKTIDGGSSWRSIPGGMIDDSDIFSIVVDRNRAQRVFAGACSGIYRSLNGGAGWSRLAGSNEASYRTYTLVQDPLYENVLLAGTSHGMVRSADGGATWKKIAPYATHSIAFALPHIGRIFIATDEAGILRSDDNGKSWTPANLGFCNRRLGRLAIGGAGALYTSAIHDQAEGGYFVLPKDAEEWSEREAPGKQLTMLTPSSAISGTMYAATRTSMLVSRDAGVEWARLTAPTGAAPVTDMLAPPWTPETLLAAAGSRLFVNRASTKAWAELLFASPLRSLVALDAPHIAAVTQFDIFLTSDGESWQPCAPPAAGSEVYGIAASRARLIAATGAGLRVSVNGCRSWESAGGPLDRSTVQAICRHPGRPSVVFAASYGRIYASADAGVSWQRISPDAWPVDSVKQVVVAPGAPDRLLVLSPQQGVFALPLSAN